MELNPGFEPGTASLPGRSGSRASPVLRMIRQEQMAMLQQERLRASELSGAFFLRKLPISTVDIPVELQYSLLVVDVSWQLHYTTKASSCLSLSGSCPLIFIRELCNSPFWLELKIPQRPTKGERPWRLLPGAIFIAVVPISDHAQRHMPVLRCFQVR